MNLEIKKTHIGWDWGLIVNGKGYSCCESLDSVEKALEAGSKKLLELLPKETFDFGDGPVPAHRHKNGGGWVANTARVGNSVYIGSGARVYGEAEVVDNAQILDHARVYENAVVRENTIIRDNARVFGNACISGNAEVAEFAHILGQSRLSGLVKICGTICFHGASLYGEN